MTGLGKLFLQAVRSHTALSWASLSAITLLTASAVYAQPRDVFFEKTYCATEQGRGVAFFDSNDEIPRAVRQDGRLVIQGSLARLQKVHESTARFLFTRACFEASAKDANRRISSQLDCDVLQFIARRYGTGSTDLNTIAEDLLNMRNATTERIAKHLYGC